MGYILDHLLLGLAQKYRISKPELDAESLEYLKNHKWPGNNRELLHELERAIVLHEPGNLLHLPSSRGSQGIGTEVDEHSDWLNQNFKFPSSGFQLENQILRLIHQAIQQADGNVSAAARLLGVPRDYLRYRLDPPKGKNG